MRSTECCLKQSKHYTCIRYRDYFIYTIKFINDTQCFNILLYSSCLLANTFNGFESIIINISASDTYSILNIIHSLFLLPDTSTTTVRLFLYCSYTQIHVQEPYITYLWLLSLRHTLVFSLLHLQDYDLMALHI